MNKGVSEVVKGKGFQERFLKCLRILCRAKRQLNWSIQSLLTFAKIIKQNNRMTVIDIEKAHGMHSEVTSKLKTKR